MNSIINKEDKTFVILDIFAFLALVASTGFISFLGIMEFYMDVTPIILLRLIAAFYLIMHLHSYKKKIFNKKLKWVIVITQIILAYIGTFDADRMIGNVKFQSSTIACLTSSTCRHDNSLYYSGDEPRYAVFRNFPNSIYYYKNNDGYQAYNFDIITSSYSYNEGNYLIEIYKLPESYYIFVQVLDDDISKVTDNSNKDFDFLHTLRNKNYDVRTYYGKTIDKIEDYHLKLEGKELEINIQS